MVEESEAMEAENVIDYCEMLSETLGEFNQCQLSAWKDEGKRER